MAKSSQNNPVLEMHFELELLPGLSSQDQTLLASSGIKSTLELLQRGESLSQRQALAAQLQVHIQYVNKWVAMADLSRIPSVGYTYCGLLLHSGIASTAQLARMSVQTLQQQVKRFVVSVLQQPKQCPDAAQMAQWIQEAQYLISRG